MTRASAITQMATILAAETSVTRIHQDPPESLSEFPCFVLRWLESEMVWITPTVPDETATMLCLLYTNRQFLPLSNADANIYLTEFLAAIAQYRTLNDALIAIERVRALGPDGMTYGSATHYGIRFEIIGKLNEAF